MKRPLPNCSAIYVRVSYVYLDLHSKNFCFEQIVNQNRPAIQYSTRLSILMALAVNAHRAEEQLRPLKTTFNKAESQIFRLDTRRPTVFKGVGQDFEPLKH